MDTELKVLERSVAHLRDVANALDDDVLTRPAYPSEWTIADVLSHLGSGAVIMQRRLDDGVRGETMPDDFAPQVWDTWNAKSPHDKAADALVADRALVERLGATTPDERAAFTMSMGPMTFDITGLVRLRLNEHSLHAWDIDVALDPSAVVAPDAVDIVIDNLDLIARFTGKARGVVRTITVTTRDPERHFTVDLAADAVTFAPGQFDGTAVLSLTAEAFVRLVYGRLDPAHTPPFDGSDDALEALRDVYRGV